MSKRRINLGKLGEQKAVEYLQKANWKILERNFRSRFGEIDIVAQDGDFLVLVEVKTRWSEKYGLPEEAVIASKIHSIIKTGYYYKKIHPETPDLIRIDVIAIEIDSSCNFKDLRHHKNVTG